MRGKSTIDFASIIDYEDFFQSAAIGMFRRNGDGTFIVANPALLALLEVESVDDLNQQESAIPDAPDERERILRAFREEEQIVGLETRWQTGTGGIINVRLSGRLLFGADHEPLFYEAVVEDVTARRAYEQELRRAREDAEEASRTRMSFLSTLNHEIRTPLTAIIGFSAVLAREVPEQQRRHAHLVEESARRLLESLNSVLTYANLDAARPRFRLEPIDLLALLPEVVEQFEPRASSKELLLEFEAQGDGPWVVWGDEDAITTICQNLLSNAVKFTEKGRVDVGLTRTHTHIEVKVEDTGIGIEDGFLPHLFEPFRQGSTGLSRSHQGSGLGLAIADQLARALGGTIDVQTCDGGGSTFTLRFVALDRVLQGADVGNGHQEPR